jgi:hypothetical protein
MPLYDLPIWSMDDEPFPATGVSGAGWKLTAPQRENIDGRSRRSRELIRLQAVKAAPPTRAVTLAPGKYAREMALVNEAAKQGNIGELAAWVL